MTRTGLFTAAITVLGLGQAAAADDAGPFRLAHAPGPSGNVTYYIAAPADGPRPLLVVLQGSGCEPVFARSDEGLVATAGQDIIHQLAADRFAVMVVEKPHLTGQTAATAGQVSDACPPEFRRNHTLDNWTAEVGQAIDAAVRSGATSAGDTVRLLGLSEGAIIAARLAARRDDISHVAFLSGFGCDLWSDRLARARLDAMAGEGTPEERQERAREALAVLEAGFAGVARDPLNSDAYFQGQTHLFWSTFGRACPAEDLAGSGAGVLVYYGTEDEQIDANGVEMITTARLAAGKAIRVERVFGGGHILNTDEGAPFANLVGAFIDALDWMDETGRIQ
ncbi:hypothetical protein [Glycocaulis sp.]|uniref:hypothetical protein n=1 Tax=Glycocaulis sp. TaxID=1969725 RepID=UPI003F72CF4D